MSVESATVPDRKERSRQTKERLLDATIESLIEVGYSRTSMHELCSRADVSRGAQLHHYPTKAKLMAAAIQHLAAKQEAVLAKRYRSLAAEEHSLEAVFDLIWGGFSGKLARASIELWTAARTDPELLAALKPVEREVAFRTREKARSLLGPALDEERFEALFWLSVSVARGLAIDEILEGSPARRKTLVAAWKELVDESFGGP